MSAAHFLLSAALLVACVELPGEALCKTPCGMTLRGPLPTPHPDGKPELFAAWGCEVFQAIEARALDVWRQHVNRFAHPRGEAFANACRQLNGWSVYVDEETTFLNHQTGRVVAGVTVCSMPAMQVGNVPPTQGALVHEMAHAVGGCLSPCRGDEVERLADGSVDEAHCGWRESGLEAAEVAFHSLPEPR